MASVTGQIGLRQHSTGWVGKCIEWATDSHTHHVVVAVSETLCVSAEPGGVRYRQISDYPQLAWSQFDHHRDTVQGIINVSHRMIGRPYNYAIYPPLLWQKLTGCRVDGRIAEWLSLRPNENCSQLADDIYTAAGINLFHERNVLVTPGDFERLYAQMGWLDQALSPLQ
jgi:hypothetical protein